MLGFLLLASCGRQETPVGEARGVRLETPAAAKPVNFGRFDPRESAALFIATRDFPEKGLGSIQFPVDDAVDLAHAMVFDRKVRLVRADKVVLALSNEPIKPASIQRLAELRAAKAFVTKADRDTILEHLKGQSRLAGPNGLFIVFAASHGFMHDGTGYVMASDSYFQHTRSSLSVAKISDIAERSRARRSLLFIDACRERIDGSSPRAPRAEAAVSEPLRKAMKKVVGQAVFYATAPGGLAFESDGNGVFTRTIIRSLSDCDAEKSEGFITAETLADRIERGVQKWLKEKKGIVIPRATQVSYDSQTQAMPLAWCGMVMNPARLTISGRRVTAHDEDDHFLWTREVGGAITKAQIADLDDDRYSEVVLGDATGTVTVFMAEGELRWAQKAAGGLPVSGFAIDYLQGKAKKKHIVTWSNAQDGSNAVLAIFTSDGTRKVRHPHDGRVLAVVIDKLTSRHGAKIIAAGMKHVSMFDNDGKHEWTTWLEGARIRSLITRDVDQNARRDIEVRTETGTRHYTFDGTVMKSPRR